jgi:hypothetical protein
MQKHLPLIGLPRVSRLVAYFHDCGGGRQRIGAHRPYPRRDSTVAALPCSPSKPCPGLQVGAGATPVLLTSRLAWEWTTPQVKNLGLMCARGELNPHALSGTRT